MKIVYSEKHAQHDPQHFVVRGTKVERVAIRTGGNDGDRIEVLAGLSSGDRVVVSPPSTLVDGALVAVKVLIVHRQAFGELMMFVYFGYLVPISRRIGRGFYEDGIWADSNFIPYNEVGGISWREGEHSVSLIVISRLRNIARRLAVPLEHYGAARRLLRDKIGEHEIHFFGTGLDLGVHDERDEA